MTIRETRRTTVITTGPDVIRLCEVPCRNEYLLDLGVKSGRGANPYRSRGETDVTVAWSGQGYHVSWSRCRPSDKPCDLCGDEWRDWIPAAETARAALSESRRGFTPAGFVPFTGSRQQGRAESVKVATDAL